MRVAICYQCDKYDVCKKIYNFCHPEAENIELRIISKLVNDVVLLHRKFCDAKPTFSEIDGLSNVQYTLLAFYKDIKNKELTNKMESNHG